MECNKEEAIRARDLAERKLNKKDYTGAYNIALKAHQLYLDLENLNQVITVCEVHCSASTKVNGETDWYEILQVGTTADDLAIKEAYRKLALLLHHDNNKFAGAEAAFKLIGDANGILTDKGKRSLHDMKRNARPIYLQIRRAPPPAARTSRGTASNELDVKLTNIAFMVKLLLGAVFIIFVMLFAICCLPLEFWFVGDQDWPDGVSPS